MRDYRQSCLSHWYPLIQPVVPTPRTEIIRLGDNWRDLCALLDGEIPEVARDLNVSISSAATETGVPFFLRTGQGSGKHNWSRCCYVTDTEKILHHVYALVEWSETVDILGLPYDAWALREMLPTVPLFRCEGYGCFPVVREFRVFVSGPHVLYQVPYWPDGAIEQGRPDNADWQNILTEANELTDDERHDVEQLASICGRECGGKWSVDVLHTTRGWYVTDMAPAEMSYGWREE